MLDFRIYTFLAVCECMNFTKAADKLHITQPAVSQHIRYLEDLYQTKLFIHEGKKFQLSPAGQILLQTATTLKNDELFMQELMHITESDSFPFHLGVTMTIGDFAISNALSLYQKEHPDSEIHMEIANTSDLLNKLRSGELNFALVEGYFESDEFDCIVFSKEEFIPVCSPAHHFAKTPCTLTDLLEERLIIREAGSGTRDILEKNLDAHNVSLHDFAHVSEIGSMHTIINFVKKDCGITFLYKVAVKKELESGDLIELKLKDFHIQHNFTFIWNKGSIFSSHYEAACQELQQYASL